MHRPLLTAALLLSFAATTDTRGRAQSPAATTTLTTVTITVTGDRAWTPTGLVPTIGQLVQVAAVGTIDLAVAGGVAAISPEGRPIIAPSEAVQPSAPVGALLGRFGNGPPFYIGRGLERLEVTPDVLGSGELQLGPNLRTSSSNRGAWTVEVRLLTGGTPRMSMSPSPAPAAARPQSMPAPMTPSAPSAIGPASTAEPRPPDSIIIVAAGTYGAVCGAPHGNVARDLAVACNGRTRCSYTVDFRRIGDPAVGCVKDYVAEWRCGNAPQLHRATPPRGSTGDAGLGSVVLLNCESPE